MNNAIYADLAEITSMTNLHPPTAWKEAASRGPIEQISPFDVRLDALGLYEDRSTPDHGSSTDD
jgi:hypothetical protein